MPFPLRRRCYTGVFVVEVITLLKMVMVEYKCAVFFFFFLNTHGVYVRIKRIHIKLRMIVV